ncbi:hypothetical protein KEM48_008644, partial [Puccinia striiformis f. sp. tritici PST-130]
MSSLSTINHNITTLESNLDVNTTKILRTVEKCYIKSAKTSSEISDQLSDPLPVQMGPLEKSLVSHLKKEIDKVSNLVKNINGTSNPESIESLTTQIKYLRDTVYNLQNKQKELINSLPKQSNESISDVFASLRIEIKSLTDIASVLSQKPTPDNSADIMEKLEQSEASILSNVKQDLITEVRVYVQKEVETLTNTVTTSFEGIMSQLRNMEQNSNDKFNNLQRDIVEIKKEIISVDNRVAKAESNRLTSPLTYSSPTPFKTVVETENKNSPSKDLPPHQTQSIKEDDDRGPRLTEKEVGKLLPPLTEWVSFSGEGEYDYIEFIQYCDLILETYWAKEDIVVVRLPRLFRGVAKVWWKTKSAAMGKASWQTWKDLMKAQFNTSTWRSKMKEAFRKEKLDPSVHVISTWCVAQHRRLECISPGLSLKEINEEILERCPGTLANSVNCRLPDLNVDLTVLINTMEDIVTKMPKSQKQKKAKAADFTKAKLKLGKGKQVANNATNTSYSSKIIALPNQKIRTENTAIPTTKSNLTLDDLIVRLRHYSGNTRKEALLGLRELLDAHRSVWRLNLGTVIHSCACLISDENPAVRKALKSFFSWFLPKVDLSLLKPFCSIIIFFASSALSHIFADIRVDAIYIIDILLDVAPDCVVAGWPRDRRADLQSNGGSDTQSTNLPQQPGLRLLQLYLSLLSIGSDSTAPGLSSTSANQLSGNSKLVVLKSLARFIGAASSLDSQQSSKNSMPLWIFRSAFRKERDFDTFQVLLTESAPPTQDHSATGSHTLNTEHYNSTNSHTFERFSEAFLESDNLQGNMSNPSGMGAESSGSTDRSLTTHPTPDNSLHLLRAMHPVMLSSSAGASVSPSLELVNCVVTSLHRLWQASLAADLAIESKDVKSLETILMKMAPYFIFGADDISPQGTELRHLLQNLNLMYCDLVSLLALVKPDCSNTVTIQLNQVGSYITRLLENK